MQDRFKFRGITKGKVNEFVYGSLLWYAGEPQIWDKDGKNYIVKPETIQQCTGLKDKNGKLIFEGDIVNQIYEDETIYKCEVVYNNCSFQLKHIEDKNVNYINTPMYCYAINYLGHYTEKKLEVIGNIYENPELLED